MPDRHVAHHPGARIWVHLVLTLLCTWLGVAITAAERTDQELAAGWHFLRADAPLTADVAEWSAVTIPHTWNAADILPLPSTGRDAPHPQPYRGVGWYQRTLTLDPTWRGRRIFIRFAAASLIARVYLNGTLLGEHRGGFTAFCYELTDQVQWSGVNELRVRVDNAAVPTVAPLAGDFNVQGGIYRPVHLLVTDSDCISPLDHASPGIFIQQEQLTDAVGELSVRTSLSGIFTQPTTLEVAVYDADYQVVARSSAMIPPQATALSSKVRVPQPHRWQGRADPYLYTCEVGLARPGIPGDSVSVPFGFRTVAITDAEGFLLNGKPYPIHGVNRHMDVQGKGWAIGSTEEQRDVAFIQELGATAVRLPHLPQSEVMHHLCDQAGILVWAELPLVNRTTPGEEFAANAEQQLTEMICQLGNHPAIAFWSLYNEIRDDVERNAQLLARLKAVIQARDPARLIVGATCIKANPMHLVPDWNCWNKYPGWYSGKSGDLGALVTGYAAEIGKRAGIAEYGCGGNPQHHQEDESRQVAKATQVFHPEEYQAYNHERNWASLKDNPHCWGSFIWNLVDFTAAERNEGGFAGLNDKGLVTYDRTIRKDAFYFYRANWNPQPMLHLCGSRFTQRQAAQVAVKAYVTSGPVELRVNGVLIGEAQPDAIHVVRWPAVTLAQGANRIEVRAGSLADAATWTWDPAKSASNVVGPTPY